MDDPRGLDSRGSKLAVRDITTSCKRWSPTRSKNLLVNQQCPRPAQPPSNAAPRRKQHHEAPPDLAALRFQAATEARLAKQHEQAAALYETFLKLHPNDPRASLVAFELGRTRMDVLGDPARAISALQRSLRLGPQSPFREDALARLVRLHEAQGQSRECARIQQTYVREYPQGRLIGDVRQRCGDL